MHNHRHCGTYSISSCADELQALLEFADLHPGDRLLDVGTGSGKCAAAFSQRIKEVIAIDVCPNQVAKTARFFEQAGKHNIDVLTMSAGEISLPAESFDAACLRYSAHHMENLPQVLQQIFNVLKKDGWLLVEDKIAPSTRSFDIFTNELGRLRDSTYVRAPNELEWRDHLSSAGFKLTKLRVFREKKNVSKWLDSSGLPHWRQARIREHLAGADAATQAYFQMIIENREVSELTEDRILIKARRP